MIHGNLVLVEEPEVQIVTTDEMKKHMRMEYDSEDALITSYIKSAQELLEIDLGRSLAEQTFELYFDSFPETIFLRRPPVIQIEEIKYFDINGDEQTLTTDEYQFDQYARRPYIVAAIDTTFPETQEGKINAVKVKYKAGYENAPNGIKQALKLIVSAWFENREETVTGITQQTLPKHVGLDSILAKYRMVHS